MKRYAVASPVKPMFMATSQNDLPESQQIKISRFCLERILQIITISNNVYIFRVPRVVPNTDLCV